MILNIFQLNSTNEDLFFKPKHGRLGGVYKPTCGSHLKFWVCAGPVGLEEANFTPIENNGPHAL